MPVPITSMLPRRAAGRRTRMQARTTVRQRQAGWGGLEQGADWLHELAAIASWQAGSSLAGKQAAHGK